MFKYLVQFSMNVVKFFSLEVEGFDILNTTEVIRRRNIIVNRVLMITNILVMFIILFNDKINAIHSITVLVPTILINTLISYFVHNDKEDYEKQILGMYVAVLSVSYLAFRLYFLYPATYTYLFLYFALAIIALFQNKHAMMIGSVLIFGIATFFHLNVMYKLENEKLDGFSIISSSDNSIQVISFLTIFLILYIFVLTSMVIFSEYMDRERKQELQKRSELETEFNSVLFNVFDAIEDFSKVSEDDELGGEYAVALMAKKLGLLTGMNEEKADEVFNFAISIGVNHDFSINYDEMRKEDLLKDYGKIRYKLNTGSALLKRMRIKIKTDAMIRSRYESWFISENFKKIKSEDSSLESQVVLLCETYVNLRDKQSYKKALPHVKAIKELSDNFMHLIDESIMSVFFEHHVEFEVIYDKVRDNG